MNWLNDSLIKTGVFSFIFRARFTKQAKLALERNPIKAPMGWVNSAGGFLTDIDRSFPL